MTVALRKAMPVHHTDTTDESWAAAKMLKAMGAEPTAAQLRAMHAWMDPDGDPEAKGTYKMPHHMVNEGGKVGAANLKACASAIGAMNGARGGVDIPDADRAAVHRHLAAHMMDGDMEPPELMPMRALGLQRRAFQLMELRVQDSEDSPPKITGHAAVFNVLSEPLGWSTPFREKIAPGAFTKTLQEADIRALWNHNPDYVLGRNRAGTLTLTEDARGLAVEIAPPDTQWARDLLTSMRRGDVNQMSFAFEVVKDRWEIVNEDGEQQSQLRTLLELKLWEVSPATFPAYPQTDAAVRAAFARFMRDYLPAQQQQPLATDAGRTTTATGAGSPSPATTMTRSTMPDEPSRTGHSDGEDEARHNQHVEPSRTGHSVDLLRRKLELEAIRT